jgi:hypothetical protein
LAFSAVTPDDITEDRALATLVRRRGGRQKARPVAPPFCL